jgi:hypothetical protein
VAKALTYRSSELLQIELPQRQKLKWGEYSAHEQVEDSRTNQATSGMIALGREDQVAQLAHRSVSSGS